MAEIIFPSSPSIDQIFYASGKYWSWNGYAWAAGVIAGTPDNQLLSAVSPIQYNLESQEISIDVNAISMASQAVSSDITLVKNTKYFVDTSAARNLTLPATPVLGDEVVIFDAFGAASINNITVLRNSNPINGIADDAIIDVDQSTSIFTYTGTTIGWRFE